MSLSSSPASAECVPHPASRASSSSLAHSLRAPPCARTLPVSTDSVQVSSMWAGLEPRPSGHRNDSALWEPVLCSPGPASPSPQLTCYSQRHPHSAGWPPPGLAFLHGCYMALHCTYHLLRVHRKTAIKRGRKQQAGLYPQRK